MEDREIKHLTTTTSLANHMMSYRDELKSLFVAQANDPTVECLTVTTVNWDKRAGRAIGDSETLRELQIHILHRETDCIWLGELLQYLLRNRSITKLGIIFISCGPVGYQYNLEKDVFRSLIPFIEHNNNLIDIEFDCGPISMMRSLSFALASCKNKRLERIKLQDIQDEGDYRDIYYGEFFVSMNDYNNLRHICVVGCKIGTDGVTELSNLLKKPSSSICSLYLEDNSLDDDHIAILGNGLVGNKHEISIDLRKNSSITATGWARFSQALLHPECSIKTVRLSGTNLDDEGVTYLGYALITNKSIKSLALTNNDTITLEGLRDLMQCMRNPSLEDLVLQNCGINDEGLALIMEKVAESVSLKTLHLPLNRSITSRGLITIFHALFNCELSLEFINLHSNSGIDFDDIEEEDWFLLLRAFCDKSSISNTFYSNHTLQIIGLDGFDDDDECEDWLKKIWLDCDNLLDMNDNENKVEVAREKILESHFTGEAVDISVFALMPETLLPHAIEWIARDRLGFSLMYQFVAGYPLDFSDYNPSRAAKKRKQSS